MRRHVKYSFAVSLDNDDKILFCNVRAGKDGLACNQISSGFDSFEVCMSRGRPERTRILPAINISADHQAISYGNSVPSRTRERLFFFLSPYEVAREAEICPPQRIVKLVSGRHQRNCREIAVAS